MSENIHDYASTSGKTQTMDGIFLIFFYSESISPPSPLQLDQEEMLNNDAYPETVTQLGNEDGRGRAFRALLSHTAEVVSFI